MDDNSCWIDNSARSEFEISTFEKIIPILVIILGLYGYLYLFTVNRYIPVVISSVALVAYLIAIYKRADWHFDKIRFDEDGIHLRRTSPKVRFLPREAFIPWEDVYHINVFKSGYAVIVSWPWILALKGEVWLVPDVAPEALEYFYKYGIRKNPKIKIYGV